MGKSDAFCVTFNFSLFFDFLVGFWRALVVEGWGVLAGVTGSFAPG